MDFNKAMSVVEFIAEQKESTGNGLSVAHIMARRGYIFPLESPLLHLATNAGCFHHYTSTRS